MIKFLNHNYHHNRYHHNNDNPALKDHPPNHHYYNQYCTSKVTILLFCCIWTFVAVLCIMNSFSLSSSFNVARMTSSISSSLQATTTSSSSSFSVTIDNIVIQKDYVPSILEDYIYTNADLYHLNDVLTNPSGCKLWGNHHNNKIDDSTTEKTKGVVPKDIQQLYVQYKEQLRTYNQHVMEQNFTLRQELYIQQQHFHDQNQNQPNEQEQEEEQQKSSLRSSITPITDQTMDTDRILQPTIPTTTTTTIYTDIRDAIQYYGHDIACNNFIKIPMDMIFHTSSSSSSSSSPSSSLIPSQSISKIVHQFKPNNNDDDMNEHNDNDDDEGSKILDGYIEPLLPPLRHLEFCDQPKNRMLLDMTYLIHDFYTICHSMTPYKTRTIFIDMGASLLFHGKNKKLPDKNSNPAIYLSQLYQQYGIIFDHIYAYEYNHFDASKTQLLFNTLIPKEWQLSYHWMNVGVESDINSKLNPFNMIKEHFTPNDFIVIKLDIDTPFIELPLAHQLLNDTTLHTLIDQFYFEYHVHVEEMQKYWRLPMDGTGSSMYDALTLMQQLRMKGIAAHFWV